MPDELKPHFAYVQAHYDRPTTSSGCSSIPLDLQLCLLERDDMTLQEAQIAKIDLALGELGLQLA